MGAVATVLVNLVAIIIAWCWFWGVTAAAIATMRSRPPWGAGAWGAFLGPLGILVVLAMTKARPARVQP
jgi:hypothetical protein